jgi:hypothetical protein
MLITQMREWAYPGEDCFFADRLERRWHMAEDVYQVLEAIFRQALMDPSVSGYSLGFDRREAALSIKSFHTIERYVAAVRQYVHVHEAAKMTRFEAVKKLCDLTPKPDGVVEFSGEYKALQEKLGEIYGMGPAWSEILKLGYDGYFMEPTAPLEYGFERTYFKRGHDEIFDVQRHNEGKSSKAWLRKKLKVAGRAVGRYLTWRADGRAELRLANHEFFSVYAAVAHAVFFPVLEMLAANPTLSKNDDDESDVTGELSHRFYDFLSRKISYSFADDPILRAQGVDLTTLLSANVLSDRIKKSAYAKKVAAKVYRLDLINDELFSFLSENNGFLS